MTSLLAFLAVANSARLLRVSRLTQRQKGLLVTCQLMPRTQRFRSLLSPSPALRPRAPQGITRDYTAMNDKRVLIVSLTDDPLDPAGDGRYGGSHRFLFDLARHFVREEIETVFATRKSRPDKPKLQRLGPLCRIHRVSIGPEHETSHHALWKLEADLVEAVGEIAEQEQPLSAVLSSNWISGLAAKATGVRPFLHHILSLGRVRKELNEETDSSDARRDQGELEVFKAADHLICVCNDERSQLIRLYQEIDTDRACVIPYGADPNVYHRRPQPIDLHLRWKSLGFQEGT